MLGDEARVIAEPIPKYVLPATDSFVATDAEFTPKSVETAEERQKLMFRVKLRGDPKFLEQYHRFVKTGVRGLGFVRTDPKACGARARSQAAAAMSEPIVASVERVTHRYGKTFALNDVTLSIPAQCMVGMIGPDGVGKSTLLALISGVRKIQAGR